MATRSNLGRGGDATVIGAGLVVEGSIECPDGIGVHGRVVGPVTSGGPIDLAESATIEGDVRGSVVRIAGTLTGDVRAAERIELLAGARVRGDLHAPRITIAEGAVFRGRVEMGGAE